MDLAQIGTGVFRGDFQAGSAQWHALRRTGVTGSDISSIMGVNKWVSAYACWARKLGLIPDQESSEAMEWGGILETVIRDQFVKKTGWSVIQVGTYSHQERPWMLANPDGIIVDGENKYLFEAKTATYEDDWIVPPENTIGHFTGVPRYYRTQVQHYLDVFGFSKGFLAVLFHGNKFRIYEIPADEFEQSNNRAAAENFIRLINRQIAPDWDGSKATYDATRAMHPDIEPESVDLGDLGIHLSNQNAKVAAETELLTELKSRTMSALGKAKTGYVEVDGERIVVATRQSKSGGSPFLVIKK